MPCQVDGFKVCTNKCCKQTNPQSIIEFHKDKKAADKLSSQCKSCNNVRTSRHSRLPEVKVVAANRQLKKLYGITLEQKQEMFDNQQGKCANIGCDYYFKDLSDAHVDHCHKTNKLRHLLCARCNHALGQLKEDIGRILGLAEYIKDFQ